jgi:hypothetical protein
MTKERWFDTSATRSIERVPIVVNHLSFVMTGLVPAIQAQLLVWMRGTSPRMTRSVIQLDRKLLLVPRTLLEAAHSKRGDGMSLIDLSDERSIDPLDMVERVASVRQWSFDRAGADEVTISVPGRWSDYHVSFTWMHEVEALHLACTFDLKVPECRHAEVRKLLSHINEQLWAGHFDLWTAGGVVMFRHALILAGGAHASATQCEALLEAALDACERYFQAFQFVVWAGKTAREAIDHALFDTSGEA